MGLCSCGNGGFGGGGVGDVAGYGDALDLGGNRLGELGIEIEDRDFGALRRKLPRGRRAQSRCAAGDDGWLIP